MDNCDSSNVHDIDKNLHIENGERYEVPEIVTFKESELVDALGPALAIISGGVTGSGGGVLGG